MSYHIGFTDTAKQDLREIAYHIVEESKESETAKRFINELRNTCGRLNDFPNQGALPKDRVLRSMGYRFITCKGYILFYLMDEQNHTVDIMAIFHEKMDYIRVMRKYI